MEDGPGAEKPPATTSLPAALNDIKLATLNVDRRSGSTTRLLSNKDFKIFLEEGSLQCRPKGGTSPVELVDKAYISKWIVGDTKFKSTRDHTTSNATIAMLTAHPSWPQHFTCTFPNAAQFAAAALQGEAAENRAEAAANAHVGSKGLEWPAPNRRYIQKGSSRGVATTVHHDAAWFICFTCSLFPACPGRGILMQLRSSPDQLDVCFKCGCEHAPNSTPHAQARGIHRADLAAAAVLMKPALAHSMACADRSVEHQISNNTSRSGGSSHVMRTIKHEKRHVESVLDPDPLRSVQKRMELVEASDRASTPPRDLGGPAIVRRHTLLRAAV